MSINTPFALLRITLLLGVLLAPFHHAEASDWEENTGDILRTLIPAVAYGTTFYLHDFDGRSQFYQSFFTSLATTYGLKKTISKTRPKAADADNEHTILATPIIEPLRQTFGMDVLIDFAVGPGASEAILNLDLRINRVFPIAHRRVPWRIHPMKHALRRHSREAPYDLVVNLECGAQCDDFIRFVQTREFHGRPLIQPRHIPGRHCVDTEKSIYASVLGVEATATAEPSLKLQLNEEVQSTGVEGDYVILNPGFSGLRKQDYRSHRSWPNRHWGKLIGLITQRSGLSVAISGTKEERQCFEALLEMPGVHSLFGSSLLL